MMNMRLHRHPKNRAFLDRCIALAEAHPDWSIAKVEAAATLEGILITPNNKSLGQMVEAMQDK